MSVANLRHEYHRSICEQVLFISQGVLNIADRDKRSSVAIASALIKLLNYPLAEKQPKKDSLNALFEKFTLDYVKQTLKLLHRHSFKQWLFSKDISDFEGYERSAELYRILKASSTLQKDALMIPDIVVGRYKTFKMEAEKLEGALSLDLPATSRFFQGTPDGYTPLPILHASISCKWTIRSDRSQNTRTEALNLIRNRKGHTPHIVAVTAEPLPTRLAALALGTGDLDCVYHFALPELQQAIKEIKNEDQLDMLTVMIEGRRLRDISDLPFDLAI